MTAIKIHIETYNRLKELAIKKYVPKDQVENEEVVNKAIARVTQELLADVIAKYR